MVFAPMFVKCVVGNLYEYAELFAIVAFHLFG
jgi:hypothetical protein